MARVTKKRDEMPAKKTGGESRDNQRFETHLKPIFSRDKIKDILLKCF
jgi:hypothetical protein